MVDSSLSDGRVPIDAGAPDANECGEWTIEDTNVILPVAVIEGQSLFVSVRTLGQGCSCEPRAAPLPDPGFELALCGCCETCECEDAGYDVSAEWGVPPTVGNLEVRVGSETFPFWVVPREELIETEPELMRVVRPDPDSVNASSAYTWVNIQFTDTECILPVLAVESLSREGNTFRLALYRYYFEDVCVGITSFVQTNFSLGVLEPGEYEVAIGTVTRPFTIP